MMAFPTSRKKNFKGAISDFDKAIAIKSDFEKESDSLHIPFVSINEAAVDEQLLRNNLKIFIFSTKGHNEVILHNRNWQSFLRNLPAGN